jgi:ATP-binding cassette, subfamily B, bacterial
MKRTVAMPSKLRRLLRRLLSPLADLVPVFGLVWKASRRWTIAWLCLLLIQGTMPVAIVYLTRLVVDSLVVVIGKGWDWQTLQPLVIPASLMAAAMLLMQLSQSLIQWIRTVQAEYVKDYITHLIHAKSAALDLAFYESSDFYDRLSRAGSEADRNSLALLENSGSLLQNGITLIGLAAVLLPYGVGLPIVLLVGALPALYIILRLNRTYHQWWQSITTDTRRLQYYEMALTHYKFASEVRLFDLGSYFQSAYQTLRGQLRQEYLGLQRKQSLGRLGASSLTFVIAGAAALWMLRQLLLGQLSLGDLALFYQTFSRSQSLVSAALGSVGQIYRNGLFVKDLFEFLQLQPSIQDPQQPLPTPAKLTRGIRFRQVTFRYPGSDRPVLENFNLTIPAGKIVVIVGDNGAGKSTLVKLLCRLYDPESGQIELDGEDIRRFSIRSLRRLITVLFQSPRPYHFTAAENIAISDLSAAPGAEAIETAARSAGIHETLQRLPQGYNTLLGKWFPGGTELSGGQWQRLALARAFLRKAQIMILDEPTSAMDPWAEFDWLERFKALAQGQTAILITHRFTLAMRADIIHVMRSGRIVESGNHEELLAQGGLYAESWKAQMEGSVPLEDETLVSHS